MQHGPFEAELCYGALELVRGGFRLVAREHGECLEPVRVQLNRLVQTIVGIARHADRQIAFHALRRRRPMRQYLQVDAGGVHFLQAQGAQVVQPLEHLWIAHLRAALLEVARDFRVPIVLLERNHLHRLPPIRLRYSIISQPPSMPPRWAKCATPAAVPVTPMNSSIAAKANTSVRAFIGIGGMSSITRWCGKYSP